MPSEQWLVVGGKRGIGLGLVKDIVASSESDHVFATARNPSSADLLQAFANECEGRVTIIKADFNDPSLFPAIIEEIKKHTPSLDHVIYNAGVGESRRSIETLDAEDFQRHFNVNVAGAHNAIKALSPLVQESKAPKRDITLITSAAASIGYLGPIAGAMHAAFAVDFHPLTAYAVSKAALNMLARCWALKLEPEGIAVPCVHPGTVHTDSIDVPGAITTKESAEGVIKVIKTAVTMGNTGAGMLNYADGQIIPW